MDILSYKLGKKAGGGGTPPVLIDKNISTNGTYNASSDEADGYKKVVVDVQPNLQDKSITISENTSTTITKDAGYDGLGTISVTTNVPSTPINNQDKTITQNGSYTADSGYTGLGTVTVSVPQPSGTLNITQNGDYNVSNYATASVSVSGGSSSVDLTTGVKFAESLFSTLPNFIVNANWSSLDDATSLFFNCSELTTIPLVNTSNVISMTSMFEGCYQLVSIPQLNTSSVEDMSYMFGDCTALETIPVLDTSSVIDMSGMFSNCESLSDTSLNNILAMCTNVSEDYSEDKTLEYIGISSDQQEICETLDNYDAFVEAGWSLN